MALYIENLDRYSDYLVTIICGNNNATISDIQGVILDDSMSMPNVAGFVDSDSAMAINYAKGLASAGASAIAGGIGKTLVEKKFNSLLQSTQDWQNGSKFSFSVKFNIFKTGKTGYSNCASYKEFYANLVKCTESKETNVALPQLSHYDTTVAGDITNLAAAGVAISTGGTPNISSINSKESNLFTVKIGKWFQCNKLLVISTDMKLSSYVDTSGSPIYATITMNFETYRILNSTEWAEIILL